MVSRVALGPRSLGVDLHTGMVTSPTLRTGSTVDGYASSSSKPCRHGEQVEQDEDLVDLVGLVLRVLFLVLHLDAGEVGDHAVDCGQGGVR